MALRLAFFKVIYFGWVSMTSQPSHWKKKYSYNLIQFLSNLSEIIPSQKTADIILSMLRSLVFFVVIKTKKIQKIDENS